MKELYLAAARVAACYVALVIAAWPSPLAAQAGEPGTVDEGLQTPTFRSEVYAVPIEFSMSRRVFGFINKPYTDLVLEHVTVILDKITYPPVSLSQDEKRPGHYLLSFTPPDQYRDGERHLVEVQIEGNGWHVRMPRTVVFPEPAVAAVPGSF